MEVDAQTLHQFLTVVMWFPTAALCVLFLSIARLYRRLTGRTMLYGLFAVPIVSWAFVLIRRAHLTVAVDDAAVALVSLLSALFLAGLCIWVTWQMTRHRDTDHTPSSPR